MRLSSGAIGLRLQSPSDVGVSGMDQISQATGVNIPSGSELHVTHEPTRSFQEASRIGQFRTTKEPDVDVRPERVDIAEGGVVYTRSRVAIMQQLADIASAVSHHVKPAVGDCAKLARVLRHPPVDCRIPPN